MGQRRQGDRTKRLMKAVSLVRAEALQGFPVCSLDEAEAIQEMAALADVKARKRVRICLEQGYPKSVQRKQAINAQG